MTIPQIVNVVWVGPSPNPHLDYLRSWQRLNPSWTVRYWTDDNLPPMRHQAIIDQIPHMSGRVNVIRLELLARFGGLYSDADSECLRPLDDLVADHKALGMTGAHGNICNATLGCEPGHPAFKALVDGIPRRWRKLRRDPRNGPGGAGVLVHEVFGTRYITPVLRRDPTFHQVDRGAKAGRRRLICTRPEQAEDTYIVHDHAESWRGQLGGKRVHL